MAFNDFGWIYLLFFLIIPLARIIPRLMKRKGMKNFSLSQTFAESPFEQRPRDTVQKREPPRHHTTDMLVLGELERGTKKFEDIKKNTGIDTDELNSILGDLEKQGFMRVEQKQGPFGLKVELHCTEEGSRKFHS